jgi:hypothetical protein
VTVTTAVPQCPDVDDPEPVSPVNTPKTRTWVEASKLKKGEHLKADNGQDAVADGGHTPAQHDGWMWDLTIQDDHDFYVEPAGSNLPGPGDALVLVHNINTPLSGTCGPSGEPVFGIPRGSSGGPTAEDRITPGILGDYNIGVNADPAQPTPMCSYCRVNPATSVDHVEARINGGNLEDDNLTPACTFCNSSKRSRIAPVNPPRNYSGPWPPLWWPVNMRATVATPRTVP